MQLICPFTLLVCQSFYSYEFVYAIDFVHFPASIRLFVTFFSLGHRCCSKILVCSFLGSMFYICQQCIIIVIIYAMIFLTESMFLYIGFMMPPTNYPVSLSVGMFPQIIMLTFKIFFYSFAESMPCFHLGSAHILTKK